MPEGRSGDPDNEIILEVNRVGGSAEVRATSTGDGLEITFIAPSGAGKAELEKLARAKLAYVRRRGGQSGGDDKGSPGDGRGGVLA